MSNKEASIVSPDFADNVLQYDIVISGGGIVGCLLALALARSTSFSVLLLEANTGASSTNTPTIDNVDLDTSKRIVRLPDNKKKPKVDARVIALASESLLLLTSLGVDINKVVNCSIEHIHVSDKGHIGQVRLNAADYGLEALGKVVAIDSLSEYLRHEIKACSKQITYLAPIKVAQVEQSLQQVNIVLSDNTQVQAQLLVISDGGQSATAGLAGIQSQIRDYGQTAIITNISTQLPHNNVAFERFTSHGPIAFLPMNTGASLDSNSSDGHSMSVVWCVKNEYVDSILALTDAEFLQRLGNLFGNKLGKLRACVKRYSYPLRLVQSVPFVKHRALTVGNASQSLHPIAGQGFNLGIRDVKDLVAALQNVQDPGCFALTQHYKHTRLRDKEATIGATDALVSIFSNQYFPMVMGRNIALLGMNKSTALKENLRNLQWDNEKRMNKAYDIIIVGAGIVGQTLAIGLAKQSLQVALIDAASEPKQPEVSNIVPPVFNARVSAISSTSEALLKNLGVWSSIERMQPYTHMHVWDTDGFGDIEFDVNTVSGVGPPALALGHIIENEIMNAALHKHLSTYDNVDCYFNATVTDLNSDEKGASLIVKPAQGKSFAATAKLLVGADGANSKVRSSFGFNHTFWDYDHSAIVANISTGHAHNNTARQAFTPFGPLAFLPLPDPHQSSIVFSQQSNEATRLMALSDSEFEKELQVAINNHYGTLSLNTKRVAFPLRMRYANKWTCKHVAIIGDAAHTIHPLAGQGANLGLSDVSKMLEVVSLHKDTLGAESMLRKYERCQKAEALKVIATMEGFKQLFDGKHPLKKLIRNIGLVGANKVPGVKAFFIAQAMG